MGMTDRRVAQLGRQLDAVKKQIKDLKVKEEELTTKLVNELNRRGTRSLEVDVAGVKVTKVAQTRSWYDWNHLATNLPRRTLRKIQADVVDKDRLAEAMQTGEVDRVLVAQAYMTTENKPYINVSFIGGP